MHTVYLNKRYPSVQTPLFIYLIFYSDILTFFILNKINYAMINILCTLLIDKNEGDSWVMAFDRP